MDKIVGVGWKVKLSTAAQTQLADEIRAVFLQHPDFRKWRDISVSFTFYGDNVDIVVSQMYDYLPMSFDIMMKLSEVLGTAQFNINQWSQEGCETCDYGSKYAHEIRVPFSALASREVEVA